MCEAMSQNQLDRIEEKLDEVLTQLRLPLEGDKKLSPVTGVKIVSVTRGVTQNSSSPMWRCLMDTGRQVNVFLHSDPDKNNFTLMEDAGYAEDLLRMAIDEMNTWETFPIEAFVRKDGQWWTLVRVSKKLINAVPDKAALDGLKQQFDEAGF